MEGVPFLASVAGGGDFAVIQVGALVALTLGLCS